MTVAYERLATADTVAASKWSSRGAVEDPAREQVVLDAANAGAAQRGLDPALAAIRPVLDGVTPRLLDALDLQLSAACEMNLAGVSGRQNPAHVHLTRV